MGRYPWCTTLYICNDEDNPDDMSSANVWKISNETFDGNVRLMAGGLPVPLNKEGSWVPTTMDPTVWKHGSKEQLDEIGWVWKPIKEQFDEIGRVWKPIK